MIRFTVKCFIITALSTGRANQLKKLVKPFFYYGIYFFVRTQKIITAFRTNSHAGVCQAFFLLRHLFHLAFLANIATSDVKSFFITAFIFFKIKNPPLGGCV